MTANARWSVIASKAHTPEIGTVIDEAMRAIEKENKRLKDILPKNFARPELDKRRLGDVVDLFTNIQMIDSGSEKDILGNTYQYCLRKFAENEGKLAGEFFTPECVVKTLVEVLQEVIKELLEAAQEIANLHKEGEKLGLTTEELAFYDALTKPEAVKDFYTNEDLIAITRELTEMLRKNRTIDWQKKETARAGMRKMVKRLLKKYKYPPEGMDDAVQTVMTQCELWTDHMEV